MIPEIIASALTLAAGAVPPAPSAATPTKPDAPWASAAGVMDFGIKITSDSYTDGHFSLTVPVFGNIGAQGVLAGSLGFLEPYISWGEQGEVAASLGFGFRHLFGDEPLTAVQERHAGLLDEGILVGGSMFLDMLDTTSNNRFWQLGVGLEFDTRYLALRGNYYQPLTGREEGDPYMERSITRGTLITDGKEPFARNHSILQDVTFTTFDFYTDRIYRYYEEGMKGWDVEAAALVPGLDKWCELWLIGGYGDFRNKPFGPQIGGTGEMHGWKAGVELRPMPQLVMSATWFEEKRMQGGDWMYGVSLQLPLDPEPQNTGKSWWRKIKDTLRPRSRHLAERAVVPVHRQNAAVKIANSVSVPEVRESAKAVSSRQARLTVADDVIFVNNGGPKKNGIAAAGTVEDGSAEHPFDTIQEGTGLAATPGYQARGAPTVYVAGGGPAYKEMVNAGLRNIHYTSGGFGVPAFVGQSFGLGAPARIAPDGQNVVVTSGWHFGPTFVAQTLPESFWFDGFDVSGGILAYAQEVKVRNNHISAGIKTAGIAAAALNAEISGNTIFADQCISLLTGNFEGTHYVSITNNTLFSTVTDRLNFGIAVQAVEFPAFAAEVNISGNSIGGFSTGILLNSLPNVPRALPMHVTGYETNWISGPALSVGPSVWGSIPINGRIRFLP